MSRSGLGGQGATLKKPVGGFLFVCRYAGFPLFSLSLPARWRHFRF
jgi:hypothetical protein